MILEKDSLEKDNERLGDTISLREESVWRGKCWCKELERGEADQNERPVRSMRVASEEAGSYKAAGDAGLAALPIAKLCCH